MSVTATLPARFQIKALIKRSGSGFDLSVTYHSGLVEATHFDSYADARSGYQDAANESHDAAWEILSEEAAQRDEDAYWEEGPPAFRELRAAEQQYEDERFGSPELSVGYFG